MQRHPQAAKLRLTEKLPRSAGVYRFIDRRGEVLYVGKATNLRARVRSYFSTDRRRKVHQLLRETQNFEYTVCAGALEAEVLELLFIECDCEPGDWTAMPVQHSSQPPWARIAHDAHGLGLVEEGLLEELHLEASFDAAQDGHDPHEDLSNLIRPHHALRSLALLL